MNQNWRAFLASRSADLSEPSDPTQSGAGSARFANNSLDLDCALVDLSYLGLIAIGGPEAEDFLQAQVSNDIRELSETHSQLNSHCSAKGRMIANFRMLRIEQTMFLLLPRTQLEPLFKRLQMFRLRADVTIDNASDALVCFGILGTCADAALTEVFGSLPAADNDMSRAGEAVLIRVPGNIPRYLFIGPRNRPVISGKVPLPKPWKRMWIYGNCTTSAPASPPFCPRPAMRLYHKWPTCI
ncbi:MAG: hypothetical protein N838_06670 [Thiohalocapsa sp. PB-PSB1]|nr:MAG: hypothetical protein N838_06670 [Thiohalocapsa sp. PB-PSB1]